ncbi:uncharacterized protein LOC110462052 [Mizuhopecten yessoensis]|uniref:uncharacterized protein LOC110462052 n=1 Tax=Mizuhopecten yessoensis TaxID=6573 RepID=UPI000B45B694|nr:uncharacterized protein LOC110462052 [Mizuhopecten yessoensis]
MDLVGPLRETRSGNRYIIVMTDYLTKWSEVKAIRTKTAEEIALFITETICRHGTPEVILTDNGREFCNQVNDNLCRQLNIDHRVTTPYHPQTNGLTERNNQTICSALTKQQKRSHAQAKQKTYYDKKNESTILKSGDSVLLKNKRRVNRKGDKIQTRWTGPYTIKESIGKGCASTNSPSKLPKSSLQMCVGDVTIQRQDLTTLYQNHWLNDKVIHAYLSLLRSEYNASNERGCFVLPCFLATKWENDQYDAWLYPQIPLEEFQYVLLPVCQQQHWFLLSASMTTNTVSVHDSLPCQTRKERFCRHWMNFMAARRNGSQWDIGRNQSNRQADGHSCGVFALMNAEAILQNSTPSVMRQCHAQSYRKHVLKRLLAESSPHNKTVCDLPFCSMKKRFTDVISATDAANGCTRSALALQNHRQFKIVSSVNRAFVFVFLPDLC